MMMSSRIRDKPVLATPGPILGAGHVPMPVAMSRRASSQSFARSVTQQRS
jgi:hypothetical protein